MSREMKNSGIPWIGEIPKDWKCSSLKYFIDCLDGKRVPLDAGSRIKGEYPYWGAGNIVDYVNDYLFDEELVLLGEDGAPFFDKSRPVAFWVNEKMWANNHIHVLKPLPTVCAKYLVHFLNTVEYKCYINGSILPKLTQGNMNTIPMILPPLAEQQRIAEFLDRKCAEVDEMIALQEQIIEELKAYKQSVITEAVTKGLNPTAPMRDSEIMFVDKIPSHWKETKTLRLLSMPITDGPHETPEGLDDGIPFISADAVSDGYINFNNKWGYISKEYYEECCKKYIPQRQDIYMIKSGASTGRTAIVETDEVFTIWSPLAVFRANKAVILPYFLLYVLRSDSYQKQVESKWSFGTQQNIGMRTLEKLIISYPSISEQQAIADYLDEKCADIDSLIQTKQSKIDSLKEYKKSIIYEYVTGKREVE